MRQIFSVFLKFFENLWHFWCILEIFHPNQKYFVLFKNSWTILDICALEIFHDWLEWKNLWKHVLIIFLFPKKKKNQFKLSISGAISLIARYHAMKLNYIFLRTICVSVLIAKFHFKRQGNFFALHDLRKNIKYCLVGKIHIIYTWFNYVLKFSTRVLCSS